MHIFNEAEEIDTPILGLTHVISPQEAHIQECAHLSSEEYKEHVFFHVAQNSASKVID